LIHGAHVALRTYEIKATAPFSVAPHIHPDFRNATILSGTLPHRLRGEKFEPAGVPPDIESAEDSRVANLDVSKRRARLSWAGTL
jgi:hypothetical protein